MKKYNDIIDKCPNCKISVEGTQSDLCNSCRHYLSSENIFVGEKIVYMPNESSTIRAITDCAYDSFNFAPGEVYTVKEIGTDEDGLNFVLVEEVDVNFSPFELVPYSEINSKIIKAAKKDFHRLLKKYN